MTRERLTAELDAWAAGLAEHEHPPVIIERLRLFQTDGLVPLDWRALELEEERRSAERLARIRAEGGPLVGPDGGQR